MQLDIKEVEELSKTLYIRALKLLPRDIKQGFERLMAQETDATGRAVLGTMVENIQVAEVPRTCSARTPAFRFIT
ncbi:MAG TPA: fumarate hydratase [Pseudolabrys sp.]|nr:fumarate hydratase [Pseudolabrys sp.]